MHNASPFSVVRLRPVVTLRGRPSTLHARIRWDWPSASRSARIQIALLVAPLLVIMSAIVGQPMNLVFSSPLELIAIAAVTFAVNAIAQDGETTWFEGILLLAIYALFALAFFFL